MYGYILCYTNIIRNEWEPNQVNHLQTNTVINHNLQAIADDKMLFCQLKTGIDLHIRYTQ